jgi:uncharacterized protein
VTAVSESGGGLRWNLMAALILASMLAAILGGVALTPGGNDALVLYGIPGLSPHALPAFLAMAVGIALGLSVMRTWFGIELRVACRNDVYIAAPPSLAATNPRA